jgi:uncharacterized protein (TIGR03437 family)
MVHALADRGESVVVIDDLSTGFDAVLPGAATLVVERQGLSAQAGVTLADAAPAFYLVENGARLAAEHADGKLITSDLPARPGEIIVIFATGLGRTNPRQIDGVIPRAAAPIVLMDRLTVSVDGTTLPARSVEYAGITPGYPGLYQINIRLPNSFSAPVVSVRAIIGDRATASAPLEVAP